MPDTDVLSRMVCTEFATAKSLVLYYSVSMVQVPDTLSLGKALHSLFKKYLVVIVCEVM